MAHTGTTEWRPVVVIFVCLLVDLLGFTIILPLMPSLLQYYGENDESGVYQFVLETVDKFRQFVGAPDMERLNIVLFGGLLGSLYSLLQFFTSPLIGALSDIYGRKPVLVLSMIGVVISYCLWTVSYTFSLFVIARVVAGISKGIVSISTAIVTDVTTPQHRSKAMAMIGVAFSLGFIFGPSIGVYFSTLGRSSQSFHIFQYPAVFSVTCGVIGIVLVLLLLKETLPKDKRAKSLGEGFSSTLYLLNPVSLFKYSSVVNISAKRLSNLRLMSASYFFFLFLFSGLEYSLTFLVHQRFEYTRSQQGKMFLFIGAMMALIQGGYLRRQPPGTEKRTALTGMAAIIPGMLLVGWAINPFMLYLGLVFYSFGAGTVVSALTTIASNFGENDEKGKVMGIFRSLGALARALGPIVACTVFWSYGACVCYMIGGCSIIIPLIMLTRVSTAHLNKQE